MQLALYDEALFPDMERRTTVQPRRQETRRRHGRREEDSAHRICAACRAREARYGFRDDADPQVDRPKTLCFECFRMEIDRRQSAAAQLARGWNARQEDLPLAGKYDELRRRRGRAQIEARRVLGLR